MLKRISSDKYFKWFLLAVCIQLVTVALYVFKVLPQPTSEGNPFFVLHHGGDQMDYFELAEGLAMGKLPPSEVTLGYPVLLVPFVLLFNPSQPIQITPVVAAVWSLIMFPVAQWLFIRLADNWLKKDLAAIVAVLSWSLMALATYGVLRVVGNPTIADTWSNRLTWAHMLSDGPATFFTLLLFWGYARAQLQSFGSRWMVFLGLTGGFLTLVRMTGIIALVIVMGALAWRRRWKALLIVAGSAGLIFLPQLIYNWVIWGTPFQSGYLTLGVVPPEGLFNPAYLVQGLALIWKKLHWIALVAAALGVSIAVIGLAWLWKRSRTAAVMIAAWILVYSVLYGVYAYSWNGGLARFLLPMYPALALVGGSVAAAVVDWWRIWRASKLTSEPASPS